MARSGGAASSRSRISAGLNALLFLSDRTADFGTAAHGLASRRPVRTHQAKKALRSARWALICGIVLGEAAQLDDDVHEPGQGARASGRLPFLRVTLAGVVDDQQGRADVADRPQRHARRAHLRGVVLVDDRPQRRQGVEDDEVVTLGPDQLHDVIDESPPYAVVGLHHERPDQQVHARAEGEFVPPPPPQRAALLSDHQDLRAAVLDEAPAGLKVVKQMADQSRLTGLPQAGEKRDVLLGEVSRPQPLGRLGRAQLVDGDWVPFLSCNLLSYSCRNGIFAPGFRQPDGLGLLLDERTSEPVNVLDGLTQPPNMIEVLCAAKSSAPGTYALCRYAPAVTAELSILEGYAENTLSIETMVGLAWALLTLLKLQAHSRMWSPGAATVPWDSVSAVRDQSLDRIIAESEELLRTSLITCVDRGLVPLPDWK